MKNVLFPGKLQVLPLAEARSCFLFLPLRNTQATDTSHICTTPSKTRIISITDVSFSPAAGHDPVIWGFLFTIVCICIWWERFSSVQALSQTQTLISSRWTFTSLILLEGTYGWRGQLNEGAKDTCSCSSGQSVYISVCNHRHGPGYHSIYAYFSSDWQGIPPGTQCWARCSYFLCHFLRSPRSRSTGLTLFLFLTPEDFPWLCAQLLNRRWLNSAKSCHCWQHTSPAQDLWFVVSGR